MNEQERHEQDLRESASRGDIGGVRAAVAAGAGNLNEALFAAIKAEQMVCIQYLLEAGADPNWGDVPVLTAIRNRNVDMMDVLIRFGADVNASEGFHLLRAIELDFFEGVKLLIEKGADVNIQDGRPLIKSISLGHDKILDFLIRHGADVSINKNEPLVFASACGNLFAVKKLNQGGASFVHENYQAAKRLISYSLNGRYDLLDFLATVLTREDFLVIYNDCTSVQGKKSLYGMSHDHIFLNRDQEIAAFLKEMNLV